MQTGGWTRGGGAGPVQAAELSVGLCRTAWGLCQDSELGGGEKGEREWRQ